MLESYHSDIRNILVTHCFSMCGEDTMFHDIKRNCHCFEHDTAICD